MGSTTMRLVGLALVAGVIGAGVVAASSGAEDLDGIVADVVKVGTTSFAEGGWRWLARATVLAVGAALGLTVLEALVNLRRTPTAPAFADAPPANVRETIEEVRRRITDCMSRAKPNVVMAFDELLRGAVDVQASDIHLSPAPAGYKLTYRVQGTLHDVVVLDPAVAPPFVTRIKVLARLDTYVRNAPQDGRLVTTVKGQSLQARVSTLPTEGGERVVLRLVRGSRAIPEIEDLGFSDVVVDGLRQVLSKPQGLFFVTGPVGSGKTTTLYASMQHIAKTRGQTTALVTLEDPIELELPFATQTQMNTRTGMTFAGTLRSVLRQDPNVLMVGEIRDQETAEIAMQAGLTGHLILTTVHAESAAAPFARLMDMSVEPFALASGSVGSLSQRLVRTLCNACKREEEPEPFVADRFKHEGIVLPAGPYYEPVGCDFCEGQGFTGLAPVAEILVVDNAIREAITTGRAPTKELYDLAVAQGMTPLLRDGLSLAERGETSLAEVVRVAG